MKNQGDLREIIEGDSIENVRNVQIEDENPLSEKEPEIDAEENQSNPDTLEPEKLCPIPAMHFIVFGFFIALFLILSVMRIDGKYVDFGDGNYLYLSWRITEGDFLYQDLPSPQPPMLLFLGSFLLSLAGGEAGLIRLWQVVQHLLTACCVFGIARRLFHIPWVPTLAGVIYIYLPEGVWWAAGYQSEPLLILFQSFNVLLLLNAIQNRQRNISLYASAFFAMLTCFTNMTAAPYLLLQWFFVWLQFRHLFVKYTLALVVPGLLFFGCMWIYSGGQYIEHVFMRQIGTYPTESAYAAVSYFVKKLLSEGGDILYWEGGFVFASMAGIWLFSNHPESIRGKDYAVWWGLFSLGSIIFVTKGGTVEYIFTIGEPAVAVFSAYVIMTLWMAADFPGTYLAIIKSPNHLGKVVLILTLIIPALTMQPLLMLTRTLGNWTYYYEQIGFKNAKVFELSHEEMNKVNRLVQLYCPPPKEIIAPPYYAFAAKRKLSQNSSSLFILFHAYYADWKRFKENENYDIDLPGLSEVSLVGNPFLNETEKPVYNADDIFELARAFKFDPELQEKYPVIQLFLSMNEDIREKRVGLVIANINHMFFWVPPLYHAIDEYCKPLASQPTLPTREENIVFFVPK